MTDHPYPRGRVPQLAVKAMTTAISAVRLPGLSRLAAAVFQSLLIVAVTPAFGVSAHAQIYPAKPVRFLVPFAPGGGNDIVARILGSKLSEAWGQQVVVDNRPGAGGNMAAEITARAAPDGYTVFQFNVANTIALSLYRKLPYDPVRDFAPVTQIGSTPFMLVVHPTVKAASVQELIALAKSRPGTLNYGSSGNGGSTHLVMELFKAQAGIDVVHIPFKGAGPALTSLLSGQIQVMFAVPAAALPHLKSGRLRALAVSSLQRSPLVPGLPTVAESGLAGFEGSAWYGVVVPAGTPRTVIHKLNTDIVRILRDPAIAETLTRRGIEVAASAPEAFARFISSEIVKWGKVVKMSGARVD